MKTCTQCGETKVPEEFGWAKGCDKKPGARRAKCRVCYNKQRRAHYQDPAVNQRKNENRRAKSSLPEQKEKLKAYRAKPQTKQKDADTRRRYKSKPDVQEAIRKKKNENRYKPEKRAVSLMVSVATRCRKGKLPLEINAAWVQEKLEKGVCEVSGIDFDLGPHSITRRNPFGPSIDQVVAGKGYTLENSRVVLTALNLALCEWGVDTYVQIAREVLRANGFSVVKTEGTSEQSIQLS